MTDYDDALNDYDWYQNTGELREYFEDDRDTEEYDEEYDEENFDEEGYDDDGY